MLMLLSKRLKHEEGDVFCRDLDAIYIRNDELLACLQSLAVAEIRTGADNALKINLLLFSGTICCK